MPSDVSAALIEREAENWPGVDVEITKRRRSNHREARIRYRGRERFIILASTPSDRRAARNNLTHLKRELTTLGAKRKGKTLKTASLAPARLMVTDKQVKLLVPTKSPLYRAFATPGGKPRGYWGFSLLANPDLQGEPRLVIERRPDPEPGRKFAGMTRGCLNSTARAFMLSVSGEQVERITRLGSFGTAPVEIIEQADDRIVFAMPKDRRPIAHRVKKAPETPEDAPQPRPEPEVVEARLIAPTGVPAPTAPADDRPINLQMPREKISLERAVNAINGYQKQLGHNMRMEVCKDTGLLRVLAKFGDWS